VGLLDADIYGPSLPLLATLVDRTVRRSKTNDKHILPLETREGLKIMSFGYVNPKAGVAGAGGNEAALLRGPVASRVITQLVVATDWGDLDYLVL
jgi:ATP-binding protein involved in chromosome partitioning